MKIKLLLFLIFDFGVKLFSQPSTCEELIKYRDSDLIGIYQNTLSRYKISDNQIKNISNLKTITESNSPSIFQEFRLALKTVTDATIGIIETACVNPSCNILLKNYRGYAILKKAASLSSKVSKEYDKESEWQKYKPQNYLEKYAGKWYLSMLPVFGGILNFSADLEDNINSFKALETYRTIISNKVKEFEYELLQYNEKLEKLINDFSIISDYKNYIDDYLNQYCEKGKRLSEPNSQYKIVHQKMMTLVSNSSNLILKLIDEKEKILAQGNKTQYESEINRIKREMEDYRLKINDIHNQKRKMLQDLVREVDSLRNLRDKKIIELKSGLYCSQCMRSKTEIEQGEKISFSLHLKNVNGLPKAAPDSLIRKVIADFSERIKKIEDKIIPLNNNRSDFDNKIAENFFQINLLENELRKQIFLQNAEITKRRDSIFELDAKINKVKQSCCQEIFTLKLSNQNINSTSLSQNEIRGMINMADDIKKKYSSYSNLAQCGDQPLQSIFNSQLLMGLSQNESPKTKPSSDTQVKFNLYSQTASDYYLKGDYENALLYYRKAYLFDSKNTDIISKINDCESRIK